MAIKLYRILEKILSSTYIKKEDSEQTMVDVDVKIRNDNKKYIDYN